MVAVRPEALFQLPRTRTGLWLIIMIAYPLLSVYPPELIFRTFLFHRYRDLLPPRALMADQRPGIRVRPHRPAQLAVRAAVDAGRVAVRQQLPSQQLSTLLVALEHALYGCFVFSVGAGQPVLRRRPGRFRPPSVCESLLAGAGLAGLGPWGTSTALAHGSSLFTLGVASGNPTADSVVLWTRLAPSPLDGGGMDTRPVPVRWEVATDRDAAGGPPRRSDRDPRWAHAVHVTPCGLDPDRWYWYRFQVGGEDSPIGRTRTFPRKRSLPGKLRFGLVSCQDYQNGY